MQRRTGRSPRGPVWARCSKLQSLLHHQPITHDTSCTGVQMLFFMARGLRRSAADCTPRSRRSTRTSAMARAIATRSVKANGNGNGLLLASALCTTASDSLSSLSHASPLFSLPSRCSLSFAYFPYALPSSLHPLCSSSSPFRSSSLPFLPLCLPLFFLFPSAPSPSSPCFSLLLPPSPFFCLLSLRLPFLLFRSSLCPPFRFLYDKPIPISIFIPTPSP